MKRVEKPWGHEDWLEVNQQYALKRLFMFAGKSCSLQYHETKHETIYVLSGSLLLTIGSDLDSLHEQEMGPDSFIVLKPGTIHRMTAIENCTYLEASSPELDDVIRLKDDYGRAH